MPMDSFKHHLHRATVIPSLIAWDSLLTDSSPHLLSLHLTLHKVVPGIDKDSLLDQILVRLPSACCPALELLSPVLAKNLAKSV